MEPKYEFDIQASPNIVLEFGWESIRDCLNQMSHTWPEEKFYPIEWLGSHNDDHKIEILMLPLGRYIIKLIPYIDENGVRVFSLDPDRQFGIIRDGQHRV